MDELLAFTKSARISQWIKNLAVFAPIVFSGFLFVGNNLIKVIWAFIAFSLISSAVYIFNDIVDISKDRLHPFKKNRPIASGKVSIQVAAGWVIILSTAALLIAGSFSGFFFWSIVAYGILNIGYSLWWKQIPILDVLSIATGFILRVYGGAFVINVHMDVWFLLTVISLSLFLAVGKRRSEMTLLSGLDGKLKQHRETLVHYTPDLLDAYTSMFANTTWLTYALFTFLHPPFRPEGRVLKLFAYLPRTLITTKWLMITVPVVIYGVMRYMLLIYEQNKGESPHRVLLTDTPLLATVIGWGIMVISILYLI